MRMATLTATGLVFCTAAIAQESAGTAGSAPAILEQAGEAMKQAKSVSYDAEYHGTEWAANVVPAVTGRTVIGPRAEVPEMLPHYTAEERATLQVRPGLTGCIRRYEAPSGHTTESARWRPTSWGLLCRSGAKRKLGNCPVLFPNRRSSQPLRWPGCHA